MHRVRPILTLACTVSSVAYLKIIDIRKEEKICHFMIKRVRKNMKSYFQIDICHLLARRSVWRAMQL